MRLCASDADAGLLQNNLLEYHSLVDFANPGVLGTVEEFRRRYERPILRGREPTAPPAARARMARLNGEVFSRVAPFLLERGNALLATLLPHKLTQVVCVRPSALQQQLYQKLLRSREIDALRRHSLGASNGPCARPARSLGAPNLVLLWDQTL